MVFSLKKHLVRYGALIACLVGFTACQTPQHKRFENVQLGMEKLDVVDAAGTPAKTRRWQGKDRWTYEMWNKADRTTIVREVHFQNGRVTYIGRPVMPAVSAEEQDKINEAIDAEENRRIAEDEERRDKELGVARVKKTSQTQVQPLDEHDERLRESLYGIPANKEREKRKRAPVFEPVK